MPTETYAWHKKKAQLLTDFYKSDPSVSDWLEMRNMENTFLQNANGYSQYYDRDEEADKLEAKLKKVYTKWKKAHAEELAQTTTMEVVSVQDPEQDNDFEEDVEPSEDISMTYEVDITEDTKVESKTVEEKMVESPKAQVNESEDNETQEAQATYQREFTDMQTSKLEPVYEKIKTAIKNVGTAGQYTYIFETGAALFVGVGSKDLTNEIKAEINRLK